MRKLSYRLIVASAVVLLGITLSPFVGNSFAAFTWKRFADAYTTPALTDFTTDLGATDFWGDVNLPNQSVSMTLRTAGGGFKSSYNSVTSGTYFNGYFTAPIQGGDRIDVSVGGQPVVTYFVAPLSVDANKATDVIAGTGPANSQVYVEVYSYRTQQWFAQWATINGSGHYSSDFSSLVDIFLGDRLYLYYPGAGNFYTVLQNHFVPGLEVSPAYDNVYGYAAPGATVNLALKTGGGAVKASASPSADSNGYFYSNLTAPIAAGDKVEMQYGAQPLVTVNVAAVTLNSINAATNVVTGAAPANSKIVAYVYDSYQATTANQIVSTSGAGTFTASFNGTFDIQPGSDAWAVYHDSLDNEVASGSLYAGPYARVFLDNYNDLWATGAPGAHVSATLLNGLSAIKGTASAVLDSSGSAYLAFFDTGGSQLTVQPGDIVQVNFGGGVTRTINAAGLSVLVDRDAGLVSGTGPANASVRLIYNNGDTSANVPTDNAGHFSHNMGYMAGGYGFGTLFRNADGNDVDLQGQVPQFTVYPNYKYLYGYGPARSTVVATLKASNLSVKQTQTTQTGGDGYYYAYFNPDIVPGDIVAVDVGPLHYELTIVNLSISADAGNNTVFGTAPSNAWLNVFDSRSFGPYSAYYYQYFSADLAGDFATNFGGAQVRGGDQMEVLYWLDGYKDRVDFSRGVPTVGVNQPRDEIYGWADPGTSGTITLRNNVGAVKASGPATAGKDGYFSLFPATAAATGSAPTVSALSGAASQRLPQVLRAAGQLAQPAPRDQHPTTVPSQLQAPPAPPRLLTPQGRPPVPGNPVLATISQGFNQAPSGPATSVAIVPGDSVIVNMGTLSKTVSVPQLTGALNVANSTSSGTGPANTTVGEAVSHWNNAYYTPYLGNTTLIKFSTTDAAGHFGSDWSSLATLSSGDYLSLYLIDGQDNYFNGDFFSTQPSISVTNYPSAVQPFGSIDVHYTIANGAHVDGSYLYWGDSSNNLTQSIYQRGVIGANVASFLAPSGGTVYFRVTAYADGQNISSPVLSINVSASTATTLVDPVSGTTNNPSPTITGNAAPGANVSIFEGATLLGSVAAGPDGWFHRAIGPLSTGVHDLYARSDTGGGLGPNSNLVHLVVTPSLLVDPVHILLTARGVTQHLRDNSGYANLGGSIWTRSGDVVDLSIPIQCTTVQTADLWVGGVFATSLANSGGGVFVGSFSPPTSGGYSVALKVSCSSPSVPLTTINILSGLIDPDGFVYQAGSGTNYRLAGATVTLYQLVDAQSNTWQVWPAALWGQVNPQVTGADGYYSFFTLPGTYKVVVTRPGYVAYDSGPLIVVDQPIHNNAGLMRPLFLPLVRR